MFIVPVSLADGRASRLLVGFHPLDPEPSSFSHWTSTRSHWGPIGSSSLVSILIAPRS